MQRIVHNAHTRDFAWKYVNNMQPFRWNSTYFDFLSLSLSFFRSFLSPFFPIDLHRFQQVCVMCMHVFVFCIFIHFDFSSLLIVYLILHDSFELWGPHTLNRHRCMRSFAYLASECKQYNDTHVCKCTYSAADLYFVILFKMMTSWNDMRAYICANKLRMN